MHIQLAIATTILGELTRSIEHIRAAARLAAELTLGEAARAAGISPRYLAALERQGSAALTWPRAQRLDAIYGLSPTHLLGTVRNKQGEAAGSRPAARGEQE